MKICAYQLPRFSRWISFALFGVFLSGCATTNSGIEVKAEVQNATQAQLKKVAVLSDLYMDDFDEADRIAEMVRSELKARGFTVVNADFDADLVIIPSIVRPGDDGGAAPAQPSHITPVQRKILESSRDIISSSMMQADNTLNNLGGLNVSSASTSTQPKLGLIVTAIGRREWFDTAYIQESPRVWRVIAVQGNSSASTDDPIRSLIQAAGPKMEEIAAGKVPVGSAPVGDPPPNPRLDPTLPLP